MIHTKLYFIGFVALASLLLSSCDDFFEEDISDQTVQVIAPYDGAELTSNQVTMAWNGVEGAKQYHVVVVSPSFENAESYVCDSILTGYTCELELPSGDYQWSIRAENSGYQSLTTYLDFKIAGDEE